jgi:ribosomal protein S8E
MDYIALESMKKIANMLEQINKNLEKIANNTEKQDKVSIPTIQAIGNFFAEETKKTKEADINTIICNQNKDSYVDKNIILD